MRSAMSGSSSRPGGLASSGPARRGFSTPRSQSPAQGTTDNDSPVVGGAPRSLAVHVHHPLPLVSPSDRQPPWQAQQPPAPRRSRPPSRARRWTWMRSSGSSRPLWPTSRRWTTTSKASATRSRPLPPPSSSSAAWRQPCAASRRAQAKSRQTTIALHAELRPIFPFAYPGRGRYASITSMLRRQKSRPRCAAGSAAGRCCVAPATVPCTDPQSCLWGVELPRAARPRRKTDSEVARARVRAHGWCGWWS